MAGRNFLLVLAHSPRISDDARSSMVLPGGHTLCLRFYGISGMEWPFWDGGRGSADTGVPSQSPSYAGYSAGRGSRRVVSGETVVSLGWL